MTYMIYYCGPASTPWEIGLMCISTREIICRISTHRLTGKETRKAFNKYRNILETKFKSIL